MAAQVKRAQAHLLEHLYSAVTTLGGAEAEFLLEEESDSVVKREKLKQVWCITLLVEHLRLIMHPLAPHTCCRATETTASLQHGLANSPSV